MPKIIALKDKALPDTCLVFKHSTTCPISARAAEAVRAASTELPICWIDVREQRDLSRWTEETLGVLHESPQLILRRNGAVETVWNHWDIKAEIVPAR